MRNEYEGEGFQDPEVDREWLEAELTELQQEGRVQQKITAEQINQMLHIQAKIGYGSVFDLINDYFPSLVTAYGREHLNGGFISELDSPLEEVDLGYGPLSSSELHFDCDGVDQNAFRFYSNKDSEDNYVIHIIHKESGKKEIISGRNVENVMKQAVASGLGLHFQYELDMLRNILRVAAERKTKIDYWDYFHTQSADGQWKKEQIKAQQIVADLKRGYKLLRPDAVETYFHLVLQSSILPGDISRKCELKYISKSKTLIVDHSLPNPERLVYVKEVEYVKTNGKFFAKRLSLPDRELERFYDDVLYQICLRTLYELFHADKGDAIKAAVFNGWVEFVDKATGQDQRGCMVSIQTSKQEFQKLNLVRVEPKACFKALKGAANSTLHSLTPIEPVLKSDRMGTEKI